MVNLFFITHIKRAFSFLHIGDVLLSAIIGLLIGIFFSIGKSFYSTLGMLSFSDSWMWLRGILYGCALFIALVCLLGWWNYYCKRSSSRQSNTALKTVISLHSYAAIALLTIVISALWIPALLAFYPGNYSSDGPIQVTYFLNDGIVDLHWPAAHTLLLAGFIQLGNAIFGTYNAGVTLFCALQALFLAFCLAYALTRMIVWNIPFWVIAISSIFTVFNPVVQAYAVTTAKDSLFAGFFILVMTLLIEVIQCPDKWKTVSFIIKFVASAFGMCLMRKQGIYVLAAVIVVMLFFIKNNLTRVIALLNLMCVFLLSGLFAMTVSAFCTVREDSSREMLSLPSQQIVRTYMYEYDSLSNDQIEQIGRYYNLEALEAGRTTSQPWDSSPIGMYYDTITSQGYLAPISDPAKAALIDTAFSDDPLGYVRMYFSVMNGHVDEYVRAFLWGEIGYLYPTSEAVNRWTGLSPWNEFSRTIDAGKINNQISDYNQTSLFPLYLRWLHEGTWDMFSGKPLLTLWVSPALPFLLLFISFLLLLRRKSNRLLILIWMFPFLYWASLSLAPVMCIRYVVPIFFSMPLIICIPFCQIKKITLSGDRSFGRHKCSTV